MPTIAANASAQISLAAGNRLRFLPTGDGIAVVGNSSVVSAGTTYDLGSIETTIGPFDGARVVSVSANRLLDYEVQVPPFGLYLSNGQRVVAQSPTTAATTGLVGNPIPVQSRARIRIGAFGDSIIGYQNLLSGTASSLFNNGDGTATISFASSLSLQPGDLIGVMGSADVGYQVVETPVLSISGAGPFNYTYALAGTPTITPDTGGTPAVVYRFRRFQAGPTAWAQALMRYDAEYVNLGMGGDTFSKMLARFDRDIATQSLDRLLIHCGVNDVFSANLSLAQVQETATALFSRAALLGIPVDVLTPVPQSSSRGGWTSGKRDIYRAFRNWLIQVLPSVYGFGVIDTWSAASGSTNVLNVTDANLNPNTNVLFDLVHPSTIGAQAIGAKIAAVHRPFVPRTDRLIASDVDGGLLAGTFQGSGGTNGTGASGSVATGWTVGRTAGSGTVVNSVVARTIVDDGDLIGNNQRMVITMGAANDTFQLRNTTSLHSSLANGDRVRVSCAVRLSATGCQFVKGIYLYVLSQTATTGNLQFYDLGYTSSAGFAYPDGFNGVLEVDAYVRSPQSSQGAPSSFICYVEVVGAAAGACTVDVGRFTAVRVQ